MKRSRILPLGVAGIALVIAACEKKDDAPAIEERTQAQAEPLEPEPPAAEPVAQDEEKGAGILNSDEDEAREAEADIEGAEGKELEGEAEFTETKEGVKIVVNVEDAPSGKKGIHIHEKGDCSDIAGKSMGGHFGPEGDEHALPSEKDQPSRHLGDLGNIEIGANGKGKLEITVDKANLKKGDRMSLVGKALVIHEAEDQGVAKQPSGASGTPMACGVIEAS